MSYSVRQMCAADIAQVDEIDREAFPTMLPPANYGRELGNRLAHYIIACDEEEEVEKHRVEASLEKDSLDLASRVRRLFNQNSFFGHELPE